MIGLIMIDKISIDSIGRFIAYARPKRRTKGGLLLAYMFLFLIFFIVPLDFLPFIKRIILYIISSLFVYILWLFISGRMIIPSKNIRIAFALKAIDPSTQNVIDVTISRVKEQLKILKVLQQFKFYEIGTDIFETNEQAEKYNRKKNLDLTIHGTVYKGKEKSSYRYDLKNSSFTVHIRKSKKEEFFQQLFLEDFAAMIQNRTWIIDDNNDLNDTIKVSENFLEIILSIIAIILSTRSDTLNLSITLIETLLPILDKKFDPKIKISKSKDKQLIKIPVELIRSGRLRKILTNSYVHISRIYIGDKRYQDALSSLQKGLKLGANKINCFTSLALVHYHLENIDKAEEYTNKINKLSKNDPYYFVNKAFFSIKRKKYKEVKSHYSNLKKYYKNEYVSIVEQVIKFLNERIQEDPDEFAYLYAIGILTYNFIDKKDGLNVINMFLQKSKNIQDYLVLINDAKKYLAT